MYVRVWKRFDYLMLLVVLLLVAYGTAMIYSATYQTQGTETVDPLVYRHLVSAGVGLTFFAILTLVDYHIFAGLALFIYVGALGLLGVVLVMGQVTHGAQRWINLGPFGQLQPSELAKLAVIFALAKYISDRDDELQRLRTVIGSLVIVGVPTLMTFAQPDLGTSLVFVAIWLGMALVGRIRWRYLGAMFVAAAAAMPFIWTRVLHDYMRERFEVFLDPSQKALEEGYNIIQALIAVGSGGMFGRGFLSGTQSQLHFLRVQYADYIFSVLAEELGFVGAMVLLALFAGLMLRGLRIAADTKDPFGRLFAAGIVTMIAFQVFVNVGMNVSILPSTGIPLPFISYGGSALISVLMGLGLVESIALHRKRFEV